MKKSKIVIQDAKVRGKVTGYRVASIAKNGLVLQISEVIQKTENVWKHINAMQECYNTDLLLPVNIIDKTAKQKFSVKIEAKNAKSSPMKHQ